MLDRHLAVHEAGHAVLGTWWGLGIELVTIEPTPNTPGTSATACRGMSHGFRPWWASPGSRQK